MIERNYLLKCMTPRNNIVKLIMQAIPITIAMRTPETEKIAFSYVAIFYCLFLIQGKY